MYKPTTALKLLLSFVITWQGFGAFAQIAKAYESISIAQGLSGGTVFSLLQDKEGFIG